MTTFARRHRGGGRPCTGLQLPLVNTFRATLAEWPMPALAF
jgi:hypothetical protein